MSSSSPLKLWQVGLPCITQFSFDQPKERSGLGIDIAKYSEDIRLIFYKRQASSITKEGLDPEEVLQEVYKGILIRNQGTCPYDPSKSAFSTYVVMVMNCIVMNIINKHRKDSSRFQLGVEDDVSSGYTHSMSLSYTEDPSDEMVMEEVRSRFRGDALKVYDALMGGLKMSHIARSFGWETRKVQGVVKEIRQQVATYLDRRDLLPC